MQEGYATASTDTGHKGGNALFAIGHPEKVVDFAYRAVHETTVAARRSITRFYDRAPRLSYWNGCSTGGRQGLMEAQKYPEDFDAIVAGAPANFQTHLHAWDLSVAVPALKDPAAAVPAAKLAMLNKAAIDACDAKDGVKDGLINNPRACSFDPSTLLCKESDADSCLTAPQLESVKRAYATTKTKSGEAVFPGKEPGSETGWGVLAGQLAPGVSVGSFQVAYNDANWDAKTFDLDRDLKLVDEKVGQHRQRGQPGSVRVQGARRQAPDVSRLGRHGDFARQQHQLLRERAQEDGREAGQFVRLFMAPGMQHCGGGSGPNQVNYMAIMERWREANIAPDTMTAYHVDEQPCGHGPSALSVSAVATVQGYGQHQRRGELRLQSALSARRVSADAVPDGAGSARRRVRRRAAGDAGGLQAGALDLVRVSAAVGTWLRRASRGRTASTVSPKPRRTCGMPTLRSRLMAITDRGARPSVEGAPPSRR